MTGVDKHLLVTRKSKRFIQLLTENLTGLVTVGLALCSAALYFLGREFLESKAQAIGLMNNPLESPVNETIAIGARVAGAKVLIYLSVLLTFIQWYLTVSRWAVTGLKRYIIHVKSRSVEIKSLIFRAKRILNHPRSSRVPERMINSYIRKIEIKFYLNLVKFNVLNLLVNFAGFIMKITPVVFAASLTLFIALSIISGRSEGQSEVEKAKENIDQGCKNCRIYILEKSQIKGIPILQDEERLYVLIKDSVVALRLDDIKNIK